MSHRWPDEPEYARDLFAGTADYYARYRPGYPAAFVRELLESAHLGRTDLAVDLACGTGQVAFALAPFFQRVHAVDQEPEMVATGRRLALRQGNTNITWEVAPAQAVQLPPGTVDLVTIGNAFHRVPRVRVARAAHGWLRDGGAFTDLGCTTFLAGAEPWQRIVAGIVRRWTPSPPEQEGHEGGRTSAEVLRDAGFDIVRRREVAVRRTWTLDEIVGFAFSTSVASRRALGALADAFEADLRTALLAHDASGTYEEAMTYYFVLARKVPTPCHSSLLSA